MIDTFGIYNDLRESFGEEPAKKMAQVIQRIYEELSQSVRREDFNELKEVVKELAEAQRRTEKRVEELAEAQKQAEKRLSKLETIVYELAEAQRQAEKRISKLEITVSELAEAQKRTEIKVEELAQAQKRTEQRLEQLAEAQRKTEERLEKLIGEHKKTREQLGGLSHTVGYRLEDEAIWALPRLLKRDFGITVSGELRRGYLEISPNRYIEVNIWGEGKRNGTSIGILGEAKTQLKNKDITSFQKTISRISEATGKEIFPVMITYQTSPKVEQTAKKQGIKIYFSFELK